MRKLPETVSSLLVASIVIYGIASGAVEGATLNVEVTLAGANSPQGHDLRAMVLGHVGPR